MSLVMRLETEAARQDKKFRVAISDNYKKEADDLRSLLLEAAKRIKVLESRREDSDNYFHHNMES